MYVLYFVVTNYCYCILHVLVLCSYICKYVASYVYLYHVCMYVYMLASCICVFVLYIQVTARFKIWHILKPAAHFKNGQPN